MSTSSTVQGMELDPSPVHSADEEYCAKLGLSEDSPTTAVQAQAPSKRKAATASPMDLDAKLLVCELESGLQFMRSSVKSAAHQAKMSIAKKGAPEMAKILDILDEVGKTIANLISKKGKLVTQSVSPSTKKHKEEDRQTTAKPAMVDAATDTILTPSWWDSHETSEAKSSNRRRTARRNPKPGALLPAHALTTEAESGMDTDVDVRRGPGEVYSRTVEPPASTSKSNKPAEKNAKSLRQKSTYVANQIFSEGIDCQTSTGDGNWSTVLGRKAGSSGGGKKENFPSLPTPQQNQRKLPPLRSAAVLIKIPAATTYEETLKRVRNSGVDPAAFGATVRAMRKTKSGDLLVDLGKSAKSRSAAEPLRRALVDKLGDHAASVSNLGTMVELEVVDLDSVATKDEVLHAVVTALVDKYGADDHSVVGAVSSISVTSMWALRSGQQVAVVKVPRGLKLTEVTHVRVGWTSCRLRPRHPEATRCYRCHGFGHTADACKGPDLKDSCRRCGLPGHLEARCTAEVEQCVACDRAGFKRMPHRPGSGSCAARRAAEPWRATTRT